MTIYKQAYLLKDKFALDLVKKLILVQRGVRETAIIRFIKQCRSLHSICFLQWRMMYPTPSEYSDPAELQETIDTKIKYHYDYLHFDLAQPLEFKKDFLLKYGLVE